MSGRSCRKTLLTLASLLAIAACGADSESNDATVNEPPAQSSVASVSLNYAQATLARGQTLTVQAMLKNASGMVIADHAVTWASSAPSVVSVEGTNGGATARAGAAGSAEISASVDGVTAKATIAVIAFQSIVSGAAHTCALTQNQKLYCAGSGSPWAIQVSPQLSFTAVAIGGVDPSVAAHVCAIDNTQSAYCWGTNALGELGTGDNAVRTSPTLVSGGLKFTSLSAGLQRTCGVSVEGTAYCWGDNTDGRLGDGTTQSRLVPTKVQMPGDLKVGQISTGATATCAVATTGQAYCWGTNRLGQLGSREARGGLIGDFSAIPVKVDSASSTKQIATMGPKTCLLTTAGKAYCFGNNTVKELGAATDSPCDAGTKPCSLTPVPVGTNETFTSLSALWFGNCGVTTGRRVLCWGMNWELTFGISSGIPACTTAGALFPCTTTPIEGPSDVVSLSGYRNTQCAVKTDGIAYCWGGNAWGQRSWGDAAPDATPRPFSVAP
jgi:alpha-tubulin suppressor-like RCC1 family protein